LGAFDVGIREISTQITQIYTDLHRFEVIGFQKSAQISSIRVICVQKKTTMKKISNFIFTKLLGWKFENVQPEVSKCVIAVAPHTSNSDFLIGKLAYSALGRKSQFLMKKEWFVFPLSLIFKAMGGIPVSRNRHTSMTDTLAAEFSKHDRLQIAVTPEGTRKRVTEWKRGFYYIALKAKVPILLIGLDYKKKAAIFLDTFLPTGNFDVDIAKIKACYAGVVGKYPEKFAV
jgi:1-acyl-sn-glycerol-3-phosphate acyltransferase